MKKWVQLRNGKVDNGFLGRAKKYRDERVGEQRCRGGSLVARSSRVEAGLKARREGYAKALEKAKITGVMPDEFQRTVPEDEMGRQIGVKIVALRELEKLNPNHPLVVSQTVRKNIGLQTMMNYNRANRPDEGQYLDYAPSDLAAQ